MDQPIDDRNNGLTNTATQLGFEPRNWDLNTEPEIQLLRVGLISRLVFRPGKAEGRKITRMRYARRRNFPTY